MNSFMAEFSALALSSASKRFEPERLARLTTPPEAITLSGP